MQVGEVVAERFVLEELIGSGGMGDVHRALDRPDRRVAQLRENAGLAQEPLVANGVSADGERYIASEWL